MNLVVLTIGAHPVTWGQVAVGTAALSFGLLVLVAVLLLRTRRDRALEAAIAEERAREMDDKMSTII